MRRLNMPKISDTKLKSQKDFKKKDYRAWNISDQLQDNTAEDKPDTQKPEPLPESIIEVSPDEIINWEYHDRPEKELGDLEAFAQELERIGQQQPCVARPLTNKKGKYELLIGERRWRAAKLANIPLKVVVRSLSDHEAAIAQAAENEDRKDLSDYAKGMSFHRLIESGIIQQKDLIQKLGKSKQYISALLSFPKIPKEILNSIDDFSNISARTAEEIKQLGSKGEKYIEAIIALVPKIQSGSIGQKSLRRLVEANITEKVTSSNKRKFIRDGRHLVTLRNDNNLMGSFHFPKNIINSLSDRGISLDALGEDIADLIENKFK
jgi:ParB family chromosome partitioning protein